MLIDHLKLELSERCRKNPRYSLRAFAKSMLMDSATLSAIMNRKRVLTPKTARRILDQLEMDAAHRKRMLLACVDKEETGVPDNFCLLDEEVFATISSWEHYALLSLLETNHCQHRIQWMAARLALPTGIVIDALGRLERVGLVKKENGRWIPTGKSLTTTNDIPSATLRKANRQYIERSLVSLDTDSTAHRDITGITMAISKNKLPEAKRLIKEFRRSMCDFLESGDKDEVFFLFFQLFPLTRTEMDQCSCSHKISF